MSYVAPDFLDQDTQVQEERGHDDAPSIEDCVHTFLNNTRHRFGEHSVEVNTINAILNSFRNGEITKRDALSSITLTLRDQDDIKQDLMNVLYHKDAKWGADDFDFDQLVAQSCPQFLQPAHEPQMRLPPISSLYPNRLAVQSINPAVLNVYGGLATLANDVYSGPIFAQHGNPNWTAPAQVPSSPQWQMPTSFHSLNQPAMTQASEFSHYKNANEADMSPAHEHFSGVAHPRRIQGDWENIDHSDDYATHIPIKKEVSADASPSVLGSPFAMPLGRPAVDMPPPPLKRSHQSVSSTPGTPTTPAATLHQPKKQPSSTVKVAQSQREAPSFIHSICGKGFSSRSKVKKHHWGAKNDDLNTTTGCCKFHIFRPASINFVLISSFQIQGVKHSKPNVSWDEHPSCKESTVSQRAVKKTNMQSTPRDHLSEQKAPVVPAMIPSYNTIPGFPILQDLPQTVAQALTLSNPTQHTFEHIGSYHSHRLPTSSNSFDSLLTAVNVASRIDAPKPQGRNDSVVSHLDAQAAAAERDVRYTSTCIDDGSLVRTSLMPEERSRFLLRSREPC
ncbi:hypothetical protein N0V83_004681 [Neocucurbitaria cava]|uniref:Uncharacterized protein n=1 Tax=Neocucurbitaria cava TaxID=798079 RepID=A0A9W8YA77_9PLEO|nr:hypothetical protein N0V83_004681 [Neocucurbitaria cava]